MKIIARVFLLIWVIITIAATNVYSQRKKIRKQKYEKVFVGIDYGNYKSKLVVVPDSNWELFQKEKNSWKNGKGNFFQFIIGGSLNKNISFLTGISFNNFEIIQTDGFNFWRCDPSYYGATKIVSSERIISLRTIEVPIESRYKFKFNKISFYPTFGIRTIFYNKKFQEIDFLLDNKEIGEHQLNDKEITHNLKSNFALEFKLGASYRFFEKLSLKIEPFHRTYLKQDEILEQYSKTKFRSLGLIIGLEYAIIYE